MFNDEAVRQQAIVLAASQNEGAMRQVLDDFNERIAAMEGGAAPSVAPPPAPAEVPLDERIRIAIRALPPDGYGTSGKPNVAAIEQALGEPITAAERDRVWAAMQEAEA